MTTVGIIGAGKLGTVLARLTVAAGYPTLIAASGDPAAIELIIDVMSPGAVATSATDAATRADIVILAVPLRRLRDLPLAQLDGKIVVDAMNYWPPVDGIHADFEERASSPVVAEAIPGATVVKSFSHLGYHQLDEDARPAGAADRHAIAVAGDNPGAVAEVAEIIDRLGFDPVIAGALEDSSRFGPGSDLFGVSADRASVERLLGITAPLSLTGSATPRPE